jgi:hypothetical protein
MADFLSRLAERTLGIAPVIRPLTTPMFASGPTLAGGSLAGAAWEHGLSTSIGAPSRGRSRLVQEVAASGGAWEEESSLPKDNLGEALVAAQQFLSSSSEARGETGKGLLYSRPDRRVVTPGLLPQAVRGTAQGMTSSHGENSLSASPAPESHLRTSLEFPMLVAKQTPSERASPFQPSQELFRLRPLSSEEEDAASNTRPEQIARGTLYAGSSQSIGVSESPSLPPVIRVTIGRIEVRAVTPPVPPASRPAPTRSSSSVSLAEYLQQRSKGQR